MGLFHTKDKHEFRPLLVEIEERPLNPLGRALLWTVILFMVLASLWLYFAQIDVVVSARGKVIPHGEIKVMQPIETGVISKILVREGQYVEKDQILMEIDPSVTETNLESKKRNLELLDVETARLDALIGNTPFIIPPSCRDASVIATQQQIYTSTKSAYDQQMQLLNEQIAQVNEQVNGAKIDRERLARLYESAKAKEERLTSVLDIIAKSEYEEAKNEAQSYGKQVTMKEHEILQLASKRSELNEQRRLVTQEYRNRLLEELTQKRKEATALQVEVEAIEFKSAKQRLRAPVDGYVGKLMVHTVGGVVTPAEKLISIVPKDAPLVIKATVMNQDIGFVKNGMAAAIKVDTFDFQKYGLIDGNVTHVSDDAIEDEKLGPVYEVYIEPQQHTLMVEGEELRLHSGMSVTAELKVGNRRIIEFFIYPLIKYMDEGMSVR
jgi:hemolysin D